MFKKQLKLVKLKYLKFKTDKRKAVCIDIFFCIVIATLITRGFHVSGNKILPLVVSLFLGSSLKSFKHFIVYPILLLSLIYMPIGMIYGSPNFGIVVSLFQTNTSESVEFISNYPTSIYCYFGLYIIFYSFYVKHAFTELPFKKLRILFALILMFSPQLSVPISFAERGYTAYQAYKKGTSELDESMRHRYHFNVIKNEPRYKTYVVVIGESMRKDYMSLYGYPITTTPFLDSVNGFFLDGYISTSPNTAPSLPRTLALSRGIKVAGNINFISLANSSNFDTYWLSNQGYTGRYDTAISKIAVLSDHVTFLKRGDYGSQNIFDDKLVPYFTSILKSSDRQGNKLIVLHLMGSHPTFSRRVKEDHYNLKRRSLSFYLSTYYETDALLKNIYTELKSKEDSFSLIYFSDHGLSNRNGRDQDIFLAHNANKKSNYEIPFIRLSSDDTKRVFKKANISAFHFMAFFSDWIGVKTKMVVPLKIDDFKSEKVKVFNWSKMVYFDDLTTDIVIIPAKI